MLLMYVVILDIFQHFTRYTKDNNPVKGSEYACILDIYLKYNQYYDVYIGSTLIYHKLTNYRITCITCRLLIEHTA
ncbi:hypothetical protein CRT38_04965 [Anaplasma phagocytophilum str. CRT38]|uniref:Uncharacterized protein n=1 Tax=Anaplasma phagocytophilum str. CRT38 TaxID=1269275 RepID=S7XP82_ANAPH|nr:hypothetical protein CRT38_04965 [Anaplasma phagocytophilum str. CRT38]